LRCYSSGLYSFLRTPDPLQRHRAHPEHGFVADMFWGDRYGKIEDPFGHHWSVGTHVRDVSMEEMQQAMRKQSA